MLLVRRESRTWEHRMFCELPEILTPGHFLVVNNTRVFPARLRACRPGKQERIEVLLTREEKPGLWLALVKPGRKAQPGQVLQFGDLRAKVVQIEGSGRRLIEFELSLDLMAELEKIGEPPLPPYIRRQDGADLTEDRERYQTIFAKISGSVAAPTAGLHFTPEILDRLEQRGIHRCEILLHVGYGTFQPVRTENIEDHRMESEFYEVAAEAAACIRQRKEQGQKLIAVGTTATRTLEYLARSFPSGLKASSGLCDLFICPGFHFRLVDGLLTNFHLPGSTLLMLVCAFAGRELVLECYREAVARGYRFFSYGDCMLIL